MTLPELLALWERRDDLYGKQTMIREERAAILWWRSKELDQLVEEKDKAIAWAHLHDSHGARQ